jgi:microcystin-dependent protein
MSVAGTVGYKGFPVPIGSILPFITEASFPKEADGWVVCAGQTLAVEDFPDLYDVIGNNYDPAPSAEGLFTVPDLVAGGASFITGSAFTSGVKQGSSATFERTGGPTTLGINNIPTITSKPSILNGTFTNVSGNALRYASVTSNGGGTPLDVISPEKSAGVTPATNTTTLNASTIYYTNTTPVAIPESQYTFSGTNIHSEFVSVVYFIKARYFSPPVIPPFIQQLPPNSGIYNQTDSLSGFLGPFPTYTTGF